MIMLAGAVVCLFVGLSGKATHRRSTVYVALVTLIIAAFAVVIGTSSDSAEAIKQGGSTAFASFVKLAVVGMGILLLMVIGKVPDGLRATKDSEAEATGQAGFEPGHAVRGEFIAFFLVSLTGAMLCGSASDLVWLFLALELTSLPTYVMVAISKDKLSAQEAAVKYFFLGALAVAIFLYGFTLIYGATGFTDFASIQAYVANRESLPPLLMLGMVLSVIGIAFKIAAAPMHFYTADVYEGAATPMTAFLAFVPKTAGFISLILITRMVASPVDGSLPEALSITLCVMAAVTMTYGNVLGLLQHNLKRMLAYSSVAHSGYMLVGLLAGASLGGDPLTNGYAAILFYLVAYGVGNLGAFAVLSLLEQKGEEAETIDDVRGLAAKHPGLAAIMLISMLSLIGLPPMVGFVGKIYLFGSAVNAGYITLVVIAVLNSAISAVYYLRVTAACYFDPAAPDTTVVRSSGRRNAAILAAVGSLIIGITAGWLADATYKAAEGLSTAKPQVKQAAEAVVGEQDIAVPSRSGA